MTASRIHLGQTFSGATLTWDFKCSTTANRHLLLTGKSGFGKSYAIHHLLSQAAQDHRCFMFDFTGECRQRFPGATIIDPAHAPLTINGFGLSDMSSPRQQSEAADAVSTLIADNWRLSNKQRSLLYTSAKEYLTASGGRTSFGDFLSFFLSRALKEKGVPAQSTINVLQPLADQQLFSCWSAQDWLLHTPGITVFDLSSLSARTQQAVTELLLMDLLAQARQIGTVGKPFIVVIDEFQRLRFRAEAPASILLTEGRKYGCSLWLATQFLHDRFDAEAMACLEQAAVRLRFSPPASELPSLAKQLACESCYSTAQWKKTLGTLKTGICIASLPGLSEPVLCHIG